MKSLKSIIALGLAVMLIGVGALAVLATPETEAYASGSFDNANMYVGGKVTLLTRAVTDDGTLTTIAEASEHFLDIEGGKDYNYFGILVCEPSNTDGYYKVTETNFVLGRPDGMKDTVVIPEGGFILAVNGERSDVFNDLNTNSAVGDYVTISGIDLSELEIAEAGSELTGASYAIYHDDGTGEESVAETSEEVSSEESETETPATGDATVIFVVIAAVVTASTVVVVRKARR